MHTVGAGGCGVGICTLAQSLAAVHDEEAACRELREALRALAEQAYPKLAADLLLTAARLFRQMDDEKLATRLLTFLQEQALLPDTLDSQLENLLANESGPSSQAINSIPEALSVIRKRLAPDPG